MDLEIFDKVKTMISEQLDVEEERIDRKTTFEDIDADSLDVVELVMALEEEFNLEIADEEVEKIKTIGDIVSYIEKAIS